jgi:SAM-dependent methyltransferase
MPDSHNTQRTCPSCGSDNARRMPRYASARLVCCRRRRLVFADELPSAHELREHYASYPATDEVSALTAQRYRELLEEFEPFRETGRLLDIGCGDGHFLAAVREHEWTLYGSEYGEAPRARARARGLDVRPAPFVPAADEVGGFDVVTAFEVLEHVVTPLEEAERISALLRAGGMRISHDSQLQLAHSPAGGANVARGRVLRALAALHAGNARPGPRPSRPRADVDEDHRDKPVGHLGWDRSAATPGRRRPSRAGIRPADQGRGGRLALARSGCDGGQLGAVALWCRRHDQGALPTLTSVSPGLATEVETSRASV